MTPASLTPEDLTTVSPVVGLIVEAALVAQPRLSAVLEVQLAILAVTSRYRDQLRGLDVPTPYVTRADERRAFIFLANTARPILDGNDVTTIDLVENALRALRSMTNRETSIPVFEHMIACIVHVVRRQLSQQTTTQCDS